jgi:bifunctional N-acetylglucosamine-1-phosphate-uridyltransferase/glucosamine-1-phosphate-acetyltransferase GlmU-like protein
MREVNGKPLLAYVLDALNCISKSNIIIVVGYMRETIQNAFPGYRFAVQEKQLGTGDAVKAAKPTLSGDCRNVIVTCGDMPLLKPSTYELLISKHIADGNDCTILGGTDDGILDYSSYGRIIADASGSFREIIEAKDYPPSSPAINSYNSGLYVFKTDKLFAALSRIEPNNVQSEYYLTDAPAIIKSDGGKVGVLAMPLGYQLQGVSTPEDLLLVERCLKNDLTV